MAKAKKLSKTKKSKIEQLISELDDNHLIDCSHDEFDLYSNSIRNKNVKLFKYNSVNIYFFKTNNDKILIFCVLTFPLDKKDSIELNEKIIDVIYFIEKLFIEVEVGRLVKYNKYETDEHLVFIKLHVEKPKTEE